MMSPIRHRRLATPRSDSLSSLSYLGVDVALGLEMGKGKVSTKDLRAGALACPRMPRVNAPWDHQQSYDQGRRRGSVHGAGSSTSRVADALWVDGGPFVMDLCPSGLEVAPDRVVAAFGLAQRYLAWAMPNVLRPCSPILKVPGIEVDWVPRALRRRALTIKQIPRPGVVGAVDQEPATPVDVFTLHG